MEAQKIRRGWLVSAAMATLFLGLLTRCEPEGAGNFNPIVEENPNPDSTGVRPTDFQCQGKTRCTEMTSCEEALFYMENCPDTEMDGDGDGIPCESQWCP
jgi:hypothetical protein